MSVSEQKQNSYVFQGSIDKPGLQVIRGEGIRIDVEKNGKVHRGIIDAITGAAVGALGWGDSEAFQVIEEAARTATYSYPPKISNKSSEALAKYYIDRSPKGAFAAALWTTSGSESNENALKIVRQYWLERGLPNKIKIFSRESSYHGFSLGAQSISWNARVEPYQPYLIGREKVCFKIPCAYTYRFKKSDETEEEYAQRLVENLEEQIVTADPDTVAVIIVETLPGSSLGTTPPPKGYLKGLRQICNKYDIIFYLDEVMCGTGRCNPNGKLNCWENYLGADEAPDIQTVGKTLGSGYVTIAGVLVGPKIRDAYLKGTGIISGGHTYASNSFNCEVALGIQRKIERECLTSNIFEMGNIMGNMLKERLFTTDNIAGDVRGLGGFWSIEFVKDRKTKKALDPALNIGPRFQDYCFDNGLSVMGMPGNPDGSCSDRVLLAPAYIITKSEVEEIVTILVHSIKKFSENLRSEGVW